MLSCGTAPEVAFGRQFAATILMAQPAFGIAMAYLFGREKNCKKSRATGTHSRKAGSLS